MAWVMVSPVLFSVSPTLPGASLLPLPVSPVGLPAGTPLSPVAVARLGLVALGAPALAVGAGVPLPVLPVGLPRFSAPTLASARPLSPLPVVPVALLRLSAPTLVEVSWLPLPVL